MSNPKLPAEMICIVCPRGCRLRIDEQMNVTGNACPRGAAYAKAELTRPTRTVTSTVYLSGGAVGRVPVKTSAPIPKEKIFDVMAAIRRCRADAPVVCGQVLIKNVLGLDADIVATRSVEK